MAKFFSEAMYLSDWREWGIAALFGTVCWSFVLWGARAFGRIGETWGKGGGAKERDGHWGVMRG